MLTSDHDKPWHPACTLAEWGRTPKLERRFIGGHHPGKLDLQRRNQIETTTFGMASALMTWRLRPP